MQPEDPIPAAQSLGSSKGPIPGKSMSTSPLHSSPLQRQVQRLQRLVPAERHAQESPHNGPFVPRRPPGEHPRCRSAWESLLANPCRIAIFTRLLDFPRPVGPKERERPASPGFQSANGCTPILGAAAHREQPIPATPSQPAAARRNSRAVSSSRPACTRPVAITSRPTGSNTVTLPTGRCADSATAMPPTLRGCRQTPNPATGRGRPQLSAPMADLFGS